MEATGQRTSTCLLDCSDELSLAELLGLEHHFVECPPPGISCSYTSSLTNGRDSNDKQNSPFETRPFLVWPELVLQYPVCMPRSRLAPPTKSMPWEGHSAFSNRTKVPPPSFGAGRRWCWPAGKGLPGCRRLKPPGMPHDLPHKILVSRRPCDHEGTQSQGKTPRQRSSRQRGLSSSVHLEKVRDKLVPPSRARKDVICWHWARKESVEIRQGL